MSGKSLKNKGQQARRRTEFLDFSLYRDVQSLTFLTRNYEQEETEETENPQDFFFLCYLSFLLFSVWVAAAMPGWGLGAFVFQISSFRWRQTLDTAFRYATLRNITGGNISGGA